MLITLCYSVLTWVQSRQRTEIVKWIQECLLVDSPSSIVFIRSDSTTSSSRPFSRGYSSQPVSVAATPQHQTYSSPLDDNNKERPASAASFYYSATTTTAPTTTSGDTVYSSAWSVSSQNPSRCSSAFSTPRREPGSTELPFSKPGAGVMKKSQSFDCSFSATSISPLCYNSTAIRLRRILSLEDNSRALAITPNQIVELHEWTAFSPSTLSSNSNSIIEEKQFQILLEAEPGQLQRHQYRKFASFGEIVAWRWGPDLGLILQSDLKQLIELMHIFRLGQIVLDGGWRVFRLTTILTEGRAGTVISRPDHFPEIALTPAELRRLSAGKAQTQNTAFSFNSIQYRPIVVTPTFVTATGIFERIALSNHTSRHDITTISEEAPGPGPPASNGNTSDLSNRLQNWYDRSPRKKSVATLPTFEKVTHTPRRRSFCPGSLFSSSTGGKSSSFASLLVSKQTASVDEEDEEELTSSALPQQPFQYRTTVHAACSSFMPSSKSHDSLSVILKSPETPATLLSPCSSLSPPITMTGNSRSETSSPRRSQQRQTPAKRTGKPPNILILCDDENKREKIGEILKGILSNDRYAIYNIHWDQLEVGGWSAQAALLILSGTIPSFPKDATSIILQFLGDGGRLLSWCCDSPPFGPAQKNLGAISEQMKILEYGSGSGMKTTHPLPVSSALWQSFQKIVETNDSEGYARPLTASIWAKVKGTSEPVVLHWDGGALGGKALLSQIQFERKTDEDAVAMLSNVLTHLGIDCSQLGSPLYGIGYLLGDHKKVQEFLASLPSTMEQSNLTIEVVPRGEEGPVPSHKFLPVHYFKCPPNFSTLEYFDNLHADHLGRLVIFTDTITSTMRVVTGRHVLGHGFVVISNRQTTGKGRGQNVWLSPEGCATFTLQLKIDLNSHLGRHLSLVQLLGALCVVLTVPRSKEIKMCVKWPNDIYIGDVKVGGVLVESIISGKEAIVNIGIGVNVSNAYPTVCLNSVLFPDFQPPAPTATPKEKTGIFKTKGYWTTEKLIALSLTELEKLLHQVEKPDGLNEVLQLYEDNWLHQRTKMDCSEECEDELSHVSVEVSKGIFAECRIHGIDEYGFLRVVDSSSGNIFSVQPDGNSFDITNRLIAIKD